MTSTRPIRTYYTFGCSKPGSSFFLIDWSAEAKHWQSNLLASSPLPTIEVPPQTAYDLIINGKGIALLTQAMVSQDVKAERLVALSIEDMPRFQRESLLMQRTVDSSQPTAVNEWLRLFREEARHYGFEESGSIGGVSFYG